MAQNSWLEKQDIKVLVSIGVAHYYPDKHSTIETLLNNADLLMNQTDNKAQNKVCHDE